jgi:hypothetical protein
MGAEGGWVSFVFIKFSQVGMPSLSVHGVEGFGGVDGLSFLPNKFPAHMTGIIDNPVHCADVRWDYSIHPERLRVDCSRRGKALQDFEAVSGMLSGQPHRFGVRGF